MLLRFPKSEYQKQHDSHRQAGALGADVEFAHTSGYDRRGRVSVNHVMGERGYGPMLKRRKQIDS